ncbi:MAG: cytochrome c biogenesis protein ResB [Deltaproteobacteria bacterium]|nr:cytochrome c biogenesis protein ResB [Deltaproteobacteria bacterium]
MQNKVLGRIFSRAFSLTLLKIAVGYLFFLTFLRVINTTPPAFYMLWLPVVIWTGFFFLNLCASLLKDKYLFKGNLIFHLALIIIGLGVLISSFSRFSGEAVVVEGESFFGEESEYVTHSAGKKFSSLAPNVSFKVQKITPTFWDEKLYFTGLEAEVAYPAVTLAKEGKLWLNDGVKFGQARVKLNGYFVYPELTIEQRGETLIKGPLRLNLFPPGLEDNFNLGSYGLSFTLITDPFYGEEGEVENISMNITKPVLKVRIEWFGNIVYDRIIKVDEVIRFGDKTLVFTGVKKAVSVKIVRDPGEVVVFIGFILLLIGLALRLLMPSVRERK